MDHTEKIQYIINNSIDVPKDISDYINSKLSVERRFRIEDAENARVDYLYIWDELQKVKKLLNEK